MCTRLPLWLTLLSALCFSASQAQITLVSANTNLQTGYVLPNGIPLLISEGGALYTTNGTAATRITTDVVVSTDSGSATIYKGQLYFAGKNKANDIELWATDGTAGGTRLVKNIAPAGSSSPNDLFVFNNVLYFTAYDNEYGRELWWSDGTTDNGVRAADINAGPGSSVSSEVAFVQNGDNVFFVAEDNQKKKGLYSVTPQGVAIVKTGFPGTVNLIPGITSASLGNKVIFTVDSTDYIFGSGEDGEPEFSTATTLGIWATDGTPGGTRTLHDFESTAMPSGFTTPVLFKGLLYFAYNDSTTSALWTTDGTPANTRLLKNLDVNPDNAGFGGFGLLSSVVINNKLFFSPITPALGQLINLVKLDLSHNQLDEIPIELSK
ncbi:MAG: hypothetical protein INR73_29385, partial [Williamsia sp.]|nr:hypothetical protein [Williamsia sp.]